jgi:tetratricopeptide (TPR) repeat protein
MAFGFGFNKQKVLSAAEKFVQQGKLQNAIAEYEKVLKADPKDLTVSNTVGDLYARLGENDQAVQCFKNVGDAYASQGFTVKAIAMYKKLTKIKPTLEGILRLAELYTQQGLFNDARAQYLQVAEEFLRAGELEQAVRIFQKTLEMDPENVSMRMRLAEVYIRLGKKPEAWQIFSSAAESLRSKGQLGAAEEILQRMLTLDPGNSYALLLRGRNAFDSGDIAAAVENLEKVADLDSHPDGLRLLLQAYLQTGHLPEAESLAAKLFSVHNDSAAMTSYADALVASGNYESALATYAQHSDRLLATDSGKVLEALHSLIGHVRESTKSLETLLEILNKAGENTHLTEVYELLAHAYVQQGQLEKARDYYLKLTQLEPQNQLHARNYQQVMSKLGSPSGTRMITAEEGAVLVDELEATAPNIDQRYPDDVALTVRSALTDAELFVSYNMPAKALGPLLSALPLAPMDLRLNQRLAALHTRASRFTEAAVCCRNLQSIYHEAGHPDEATRYGELAAMYEERGGSASAEAPAAMPAFKADLPPKVDRAPAFEAVEEFSVAPEPAVEESAPQPSTPKAQGLFFHAPPVEEPKHAEPKHAEPKHAEPKRVESARTEPQAAPEFDVQPQAEGEIDLSEEWEDQPAAPVEPPAKRPSAAPAVNKAALAEAVEEIRFYLQHEMIEQAHEAYGKLSKLSKDQELLASMRAEIEAAASQASAQPEPEEEISLEAEQEAKEAALAPEVSAAPEPEPAMLEEFVSDLESSLGEDFMSPAPPLAEVPAPRQTPPPPPARHAQVPPAPKVVEPEPEHEAVAYAEASTPSAQGGNLGEFVADLEASLGDAFLAEPPAEVPPPYAWPAAASQPAAKTKPEVPPRPAAPPVGVPVTSRAAAAAAPAVAPVPPEPVVAASAASAAAAPAPAFTYQPTKIRPLAPAPPVGAPEVAAGVDLADMFGDLKHELEEETASADEDPETHYNLGVAFREMGLLDEAIGELQKVCQSVERGHKFPNIMQTYTWLAQCFLDKGVPEAAIRWYEEALKLSDIDQDTRMALHYELGASYEAAQNKPAALQHFMDVYGSNIDYRDVAERIKALKP